MMQTFFLHNSFSIIQVMGLKDEKSQNKHQKDCKAINSWLFMATRSDSVHSKITEVNIMEGSFENVAVILFA